MALCRQIPPLLGPQLVSLESLNNGGLGRQLPGVVTLLPWLGSDEWQFCILSSVNFSVISSYIGVGQKKLLTPSKIAFQLDKSPNTVVKWVLNIQTLPALFHVIASLYLTLSVSAKMSALYWKALKFTQIGNLKLFVVLFLCSRRTKRNFKDPVLRALDLKNEFEEMFWESFSTDCVLIRRGYGLKLEHWNICKLSCWSSN